MEVVDKSIRLVNFLIDIAIIIIITMFVIILFDSFAYSARMFLYLTIFGYYFLLEWLTGQTVGKMVTNTQVVMKNSSKPSFIRIFMRSFLRIIPIDVFTYLFGNGNGLHDLLSGTRLVKKGNN